MGHALVKLLGFARTDLLLRKMLLGRVLPYGLLLWVGRSAANGGKSQSFARKLLHAVMFGAWGVLTPVWCGILRVAGQVGQLDSQRPVVPGQ